MYILMGIKHCGKSTIGRLIAEEKSIPFFDLDHELEAEFSPDRKFSFREIYKKTGKAGFHELEVEALKRIAGMNSNNAVLALGGGTVENTMAMDKIKEMGVSVYLYEEEPILFKRIQQTGIPPFLEGGNPSDLFHDLYVKRDSLYRVHADIIADIRGKNPENAAGYTLLQIEKYPRSI